MRFAEHRDNRHDHLLSADHHHDSGIRDSGAHTAAVVDWETVDFGKAFVVAADEAVAAVGVVGGAEAVGVAAHLHHDVGQHLARYHHDCC